MFDSLDKSLQWSAKWLSIVEDPIYVGAFRVDDVSVRELPTGELDHTFWVPPRHRNGRGAIPALPPEPDEAYRLGDGDAVDAGLDDACEVPENDSDSDDIEDPCEPRMPCF